MIPVNEPLLGERELEYVAECVETGWISSSGRFIDEFERAGPPTADAATASPSATERSRCRPRSPHSGSSRATR